MKTFQILITLSDEEIETLQYFKSEVPKRVDFLEESGICHEDLNRLLDLKLLSLYIRTREVFLTDFGKAILEQL